MSIPVPPRLDRGRRVWPGLALSVLIGLIATGPGHWSAGLWHCPGYPCAALVGRSKKLASASRFSSKVILQAAVVLLGAGLSLTQIATIGWSALPVMLGTLALALIADPAVGKWLHNEFDTRTLILEGERDLRRLSDHYHQCRDRGIANGDRPVRDGDLRL